MIYTIKKTCLKYIFLLKVISKFLLIKISRSKYLITNGKPNTSKKNCLLPSVQTSLSVLYTRQESTKTSQAWEKILRAIKEISNQNIHFFMCSVGHGLMDSYQNFLRWEIGYGQSVGKALETTLVIRYKLMRKWHKRKNPKDTIFYLSA